jgi:hypothetical protein
MKNVLTLVAAVAFMATAANSETIYTTVSDPSSLSVLAPTKSPRPVPRPIGEAILHEVQNSFTAEHGCENKNMACHPHG